MILAQLKIQFLGGRVLPRPKLSHTLAILLVTAHCLTAANGGLCQPKPPLAKPLHRESNQEVVKRRQKNEANIRQMKEKDVPDLPDLPSYSGKPKFIRGYMEDNNGYTVYQMSFLTKEDPQEVKNWYHNALHMYQWKIWNEKSQTITATHKDGHVCTITVNACNESGYHTNLGINFNQAPPKN